MEQHDCGFQFAQCRFLDSQRIDDDTPGRPKLHDIESTERRGVLILTPAGLSIVLALDLKCEARDVVLGQRQRKELAKRLDRRDDEGGRRTQARSRRCIRDRGQTNPWPAQVEIAIHSLINGTMQMQGSRLSLGTGSHIVDNANVGRSELDCPGAGLFQGGVAIPVNRGVEDEATVGVAIRRHIRSAASKPKAQGRARTDATTRSLLGHRQPRYQQATNSWPSPRL